MYPLDVRSWERLPRWYSSAVANAGIASGPAPGRGAWHGLLRGAWQVTLQGRLCAASWQASLFSKIWTRDVRKTENKTSQRGRFQLNLRKNSLLLVKKMKWPRWKRNQPHRLCFKHRLNKRERIKELYGRQDEMLFKVCPTLVSWPLFSKQHYYLRSFASATSLEQAEISLYLQRNYRFFALVNFTLVESSPNLRMSMQVWRWGHFCTRSLTCVYM